jgi:hypothetical protein
MWSFRACVRGDGVFEAWLLFVRMTDGAFRRWFPPVVDTCLLGCVSSVDASGVSHTGPGRASIASHDAGLVSKADKHRARNTVSLSSKEAKAARLRAQRLSGDRLSAVGFEVGAGAAVTPSRGWARPFCACV